MGGRNGKDGAGPAAPRAQGRGRPPLQPRLHAAHRRPARGAAGQPVLAHPGPRPLRAGPRGAADGGRAGRGPRPRRGLPEPHPVRVRAPRPGRAPGLEDGRAAEPARPDPARAAGLREAGRRLGPRGARAPRAPGRGRPGTAGGRHGHDRGPPGRREAASRPRPACRLRAPRPGDMGWVIERHGAVYHREWGWGEGFEALVAEIVVAVHGSSHDPRRERAWIADTGGERVGSIFLVAKSKTVAKLRLLLVEPAARGLGVGQRLVAECVRFARAAGYRRSCSGRSRSSTRPGTSTPRRDSSWWGRSRTTSSGKGLVSETWELEALERRTARESPVAPAVPGKCHVEHGGARSAATREGGCRRGREHPSRWGVSAPPDL